MKMTKSEFKEMLKECIVELVSEGKLNVEQLVGKPAQEQLGDIESTNTRLNDTVRFAAQSVSKGSNESQKLYEHIFMDTAKTTLQKQIANDPELGGYGFNGGAPATREESEYDQAQLGLFSAKNRWAHLAFGNKGRMGNGQ